MLIKIKENPRHDDGNHPTASQSNDHRLAILGESLNPNSLSFREEDAHSGGRAGDRATEMQES
jgi:hypothetical protein